MTICYKRLWKLLIDRDMKNKDLRELTGLSVASMAEVVEDGKTIHRQTNYISKFHIKPMKG